MHRLQTNQIFTADLIDIRNLIPVFLGELWIDVIEIHYAQRAFRPHGHVVVGEQPSPAWHTLEAEHRPHPVARQVGALGLVPVVDLHPFVHPREGR